MRGAQSLRNEAYIKYAAVTKVVAERSRWAFYEAIIFVPMGDNQVLCNGDGVNPVRSGRKQRQHRSPCAAG